MKPSGGVLFRGAEGAEMELETSSGTGESGLCRLYAHFFESPFHAVKRLVEYCL